MTRQTLTELIRKATTQKTYAFHTGEPREIGGTVRAYPAAWLEPLAVKKHTGRTEGETTYHITLHLMALPSGAEDLWNTLEGDALDICSALAAEPEVCSVAGISARPARQSLSAHGELSVTLECDATVWYN